MPKHLNVLKICLWRCWVVADAPYDCPLLNNPRRATSTGISLREEFIVSS
jgi:hypothetical protein